MTDKRYPLDRNEEYLKSLDMTKEYTDKEIRDIYNIVFHRNDPKQIEAEIYSSEKSGMGNIFTPQRILSDDAAINTYECQNDRNIFLCVTGRISREEWSKRVFSRIFKENLRKNRKR